MRTHVIATKGARHWQGIPGIERAPNGRLWCTFYSMKAVLIKPPDEVMWVCGLGIVAPYCLDYRRSMCAVVGQPLAVSIPITPRQARSPGRRPEPGREPLPQPRPVTER
jgi:hypothetical protein